MAELKCKICGGTLAIEEGSTIATCEYCGTRQTLPKMSDERRMQMYDRANHFRRNSDYDKAMIGYKDSKDRISQCELNLKRIPYNEACRLMNSNDVEANRKAINIFESLGDFKDSKDKILDCEINIKKIPYNEAINLMSKSNTDSIQKAIQIFESIIDFEDSYQKIEECNNNIKRIIYNDGCKSMNSLELEKAIKLFETIIDYSDSPSKIEECKKRIEEINYKIEQERIKAEREKALKDKIGIIGILVVGLVFIISALISDYNKKLERERQEKARIELEARLASNIFAISPTIIANMIKCPAGSFLMGSPNSELGRENNETQHNVTISKPFYICKYEVTQKEYEAVMGKNPSYFKGEKNPVESVSWNDAMEFCNKLNKYAKNIPQGYKFDLPTEAQWEYACRAGTTTSLNSGKNITSEKGSCYNLDEVGWYEENSSSKTHPVGQKKPNAWGIYDMHGNVWEWCKDWYGDYSSSSVTDPTGATSGLYRVCRGGSCFNLARDCRSADRFNYRPGRRDDCMGFRIALVPVD